MKSFCLSRPFHQPSFQIQTNCPVLSKQLSDYYGQYLCCSFEVAKKFPCISATQTEAGLYTITFASHRLVTTSPLFDINRLVAEHTAYDPSVLAFHGASVVAREQAQVFLAATTSGKTTLTAYLTARGATYLTDDCVLLDRADKKIHPCASPLHLREGGMGVLQSYGVSLSATYVNDGELQRYATTPEHVQREPIPLGNLYFMSRSETPGENHVESISPTQAVQMLMQSVMPGYRISGPYLRFLAKIAESGCFFLTYHDMAYVEALINGQ